MNSAIYVWATALIALTLRRVVTLIPNDMLVFAELFRIVYTNTFDRDGKFAHLLKVHRVAILHIELNDIIKLAQHEAHIRRLGRAVTLYHLLNVVHTDDAALYGVSIVLTVVLATLDLVL